MLFSAALCRGLIEEAGLRHRATFSAALCRGLIEAWPCGATGASFSAATNTAFSAALCRGLIEARST